MPALQPAAVTSASPILIVTGSPGAGKTTLSAGLARASARGAHLVGDAFYTFVADPIPPVRPESRAQNTTVIRATMRAAAAFAAGGYEVFVDGIFGPWFLPLIAGEFEPTGLAVDYVVLQLSLEQALGRATTRAAPCEPAIVRQMHAAFADLGAYRHHALGAGDRTIEEIASELRQRRATGDFRLDLAAARRAGS